MNENTKELIYLLIVVPIIIVLMIFMVIAMIQFLSYIDYLQYKYEGYKVRYIFWDKGCEILIKNTDNSTSWRQCSYIAEPFVIENYGVK